MVYKIIYIYIYIYIKNTPVDPEIDPFYLSFLAQFLGLLLQPFTLLKFWTFILWWSLLLILLYRHSLSLKHHPTLSMGGSSLSSSLGWSQYRIVFFCCLIIYILVLFIYNLIFSPIHLYSHFNNLIFTINIERFTINSL